jgi:hypothetical protein
MSGLSRLAQAQEKEVVTAEMTAASALAEDGGRLQVGLVRQLAPQRVRVAENEESQTL